ncbi:uncharacterized protein [Diadema antillarum]|uniref:uncharacterized protein n=1 Tax=Diadema antillarum TaxID=105358 RepID=UPI003A87BFF4
MADEFKGEGGEGKSSKKNKKRRAKKGGPAAGEVSTSDQEPDFDPVEELRQRLSEAKISKDHTLANKLRKQLWIVQDLSAGVIPRVDPEDKEGQAMVSEFQRTGIISLQHQNADQSSIKTVEKEPVSAPQPVGPMDDKRLKNLNKKLKQIEQLKEKQKKGEKLEANQLEKIKSEAAVRQEIRETEELISRITAEMKR